MGETENKGQFERALDYARELGAEHGQNAADWWEQDAIGGRSRAGTEQETARRVLQGIEDGDPEILDSLPAPDLSGEWVDTLTGAQLVEDAVAHAWGISQDELRNQRPENLGGEWADEICAAYETAFTDAAQDAVAEHCKRALEL